MIICNQSNQFVKLLLLSFDRRKPTHTNKLRSGVLPMSRARPQTSQSSRETPLHSPIGRDERELILIIFQVEPNNPRPSGDTFDSSRV